MALFSRRPKGKMEDGLYRKIGGGIRPNKGWGYGEKIFENSLKGLTGLMTEGAKDASKMVFKKRERDEILRYLKRFKQTFLTGKYFEKKYYEKLLALDCCRVIEASRGCEACEREADNKLANEIYGMYGKNGKNLFKKTAFAITSDFVFLKSRYNEYKHPGYEERSVLNDLNAIESLLGGKSAAPGVIEQVNFAKEVFRDNERLDALDREKKRLAEIAKREKVAPQQYTELMRNLFSIMAENNGKRQRSVFDAAFEKALFQNYGVTREQVIRFGINYLEYYEEKRLSRLGKKRLSQTIPLESVSEAQKKMHSQIFINDIRITLRKP